MTAINESKLRELARKATRDMNERHAECLKQFTMVRLGKVSIRLEQQPHHPGELLWVRFRNSHDSPIGFEFAITEEEWLSLFACAEMSAVADERHATLERTRRELGIALLQLSASMAVDAAIDELADVAKALAWTLHRECPNDSDDREHQRTLARIADLRRACKAGRP